VELACERFPPLREAIAQRYGAWGREWVEQAIAAGQRERLELAAWQLAGTAASRRAHRWLADQALADGAFSEALKHYDAVADDPLQAAEVGPRRRLAAALLGRDIGHKPTQPVVLGTQTLSPEAFETLVHEARQRAAPAKAADRPGGAALPPAKLEVRALPVSTRIIAPLPSGPAGNVASAMGSWALGHVASTGDGPWLWTSTRRQFLGIELPQGQRVWTEPPIDRLPQTGEFLGTSMQPVAAGGRLYVRWLAGAETQLLCLDAATGRVLWKWEPSPVVISDPVLVGDTLVVLGLSRQPQRQLKVHAYALDPLSGTVRRRSDLVLLREQWAARDCMLVAGDDDGLVAALGGISLGMDPEGKLRWVRTHLAVPLEEDPLWVLQRSQPPLVQGDRVFLVQPGVWTVECLHQALGQRLWQRVLPELVGLVGLAEGTLVVRCWDEILGLDAGTGELRWRHAQTDILDGLVAGPHVLLLGRMDAGTGKLRRVEAVWLDAQTGTVVGRVPVPGLQGAAPAVGALRHTPQGVALWFVPDGQQSTAHLRLLEPGEPLPAGWRSPTPWETLADEHQTP
jgi:outer membrane protein assembly factor BamB